jgi:hypothetical protein
MMNSFKFVGNQVAQGIQIFRESPVSVKAIVVGMMVIEYSTAMIVGAVIWENLLR